MIGQHGWIFCAVRATSAKSSAAIENAAHRHPRDDQCVARRTGHDIQECERARILVDPKAGNFPAKDFGKDVLIVIAVMSLSFILLALCKRR
jgi:hypothetical protein